MSVQVSNGVVATNDTVFINGERFDVPDNVKRSSCSNISTINGKVYINGYELKNGEWKRTLSALWHMIF